MRNQNQAGILDIEINNIFLFKIKYTYDNCICLRVIFKLVNYYSFIDNKNRVKSSLNSYQTYLSLYSAH